MKYILNKPVAAIGLLAAVIYNIWPLGYLLNHRAVNFGVASDLQAAGQPYNWLFVSGDIITGLLIIFAVFLLLKQRNQTKLLVRSLSGLLTFGVMTAVSALLPLKCATIAACGYGVGQAFGLHDITGGIAALGLFLAMLFTQIIFKVYSRLAKWNMVLLIAWSVFGLCFMLVSFVGATANSFFHDWLAPLQAIFLVLSGLCVWLLCYGLEFVLKSRTEEA